MRLINETAHPAAIFRGERDERTMHASLLTRIRHRVDARGVLSPPAADEALVDIRRDRVEDEYGIIEPDIPYPRSATDVIVLADALSYSGPTRSSKVSLRVGPYHEELLILGDRTWERGPQGLTPSAPQPFTRMPLTYAHAFGGKVVSEYGEMAWPANPAGKGYCLNEAAAGTPLPNIEDPRAPIRRWDDRPDPVGVAPYPSEWYLRQQKVTELRLEDNQLVIHPERGMFDRAHPRLSGQTVQAGDEIDISGTAFAPRLRLRVPACPVEMVLRLGDRIFVRPLELEEVLLDLRVGLLDLGYRKLCNYHFVPHEQRSMTLRARAT